MRAHRTLCWLVFGLLSILQAQNPPALAELSFPSLAALITDVKAAIPRSGTEAFREPPGADRVAFQRLVRLLFDGNEADALPLAAPLGYRLSRFTDPQTSLVYLVLREVASPTARSQGTFIVAQSWLRNVIFEAPHPLYDLNTENEGGTMLVALRGRALYIAGAHRCANQQSTLCSQGRDAACDYYRVSDSGHNTAAFFQSAHLAALQLSPAPLTVSLHGNATSAVPEVDLSDGTLNAASGTTLVNRLRSALVRRNVGVVSCNLAGENSTLCGDTNVQGRASNNSPDACLRGAVAASGQFVHIEQKIGIRNAPQPLIDAFREQLPVAATAVNAASFSTGSFAPASLVTIFGGDLRGARVTLTAATGQTWVASTSFAGDTQVNFYLPADVPLGTVRVTLDSPNGASTTASITVVAVAPGLFNVYQSLLGSDGTQYLVLYGTGLRGRSSLADVTATVDGRAARVDYAGAQPEFPGLDQVNVRVDPPLTAPATLRLQVGAIAANSLVITP